MILGSIECTDKGKSKVDDALAWSIGGVLISLSLAVEPVGV